MLQRLNWILCALLYLSSKACSLKCRVCENAELSSNKEYYAGQCKHDINLRSLERACPFEENQFCLKLKITFDPEVKRRTRLWEKNLSDNQLLGSVLSKEAQDEIQKILKSQKTVYTQEGVLRGCAKLDTSFESKSENCTTSKMNGVELVTCLCNNADYCNGTSNLVCNVYLLISTLVLLVQRHGCDLDLENKGA